MVIFKARMEGEVKTEAKQIIKHYVFSERLLSCLCQQRKTREYIWKMLGIDKSWLYVFTG